MTTARLTYFDVLKGIAIFLVVMGHVITYGVYRIDSALLFRLIGSVHMPLFFFISGYFSYKRLDDGRLKVPDVWRRFLQLMLPMAVVTSLWIVYYPHSGLEKHLTCTFTALWHDPWKNGYWFLWVLFAITFLYAMAAAVANRLPRYARFAVFVLLLAGLACCRYLLPPGVGDLLSIRFVFKYSFVFLFGVWARSAADLFTSFASGRVGYPLSLLLSVALLLLILYPGLLPFAQPEWLRALIQVLLHCSLAVFAVGLARPLCARLGDASRGVRFWSLLGRRSLQIYLIHYFFLFPLGWLRTMLLSMNLDLIPVAAVASLASLAVIGGCLGVDAVMRRSRLLGMLAGIQSREILTDK